MKVELSSEEAQNLIVFINAYSATGQAQEVAVMLKQKLAQAVRATVEPSHDGAKEEVPAE
jgi:hypothetical protein